jgi:hypothetical protein
MMMGPCLNSQEKALLNVFRFTWAFISCVIPDLRGFLSAFLSFILGSSSICDALQWRLVDRGPPFVNRSPVHTIPCIHISHISHIFHYLF